MKNAKFILILAWSVFSYSKFKILVILGRPITGVFLAPSTFCVRSKSVFIADCELITVFESDPGLYLSSETSATILRTKIYSGGIYGS